MWTLVRCLFVFTCALVFTPLVIPPAESTPYFLGLPYTLWVGLGLSFLLMILIIVGAVSSASHLANSAAAEEGSESEK